MIIGGNIASGKSTLVPGLAQALGVPPYLEHPESNPFFMSHDPRRVTFQSQAWFLAASVDDALASDSRAGGVQERSPREHAQVFARAHHNEGRLDDDELRLVDMIERTSTAALSPPDHFVFLDAPGEVLIERIRERARPSEDEITVEYLQLVQDLYERLLFAWTTCPVTRLATAELGSHDELIAVITAIVGRDP